MQQGIMVDLFKEGTSNLRDEVSDLHSATTEVIDVDDDQLRIPGIHAKYVNSHITWSKKIAASTTEMGPRLRSV